MFFITRKKKWHRFDYSAFFHFFFLIYMLSASSRFQYPHGYISFFLEKILAECMFKPLLKKTENLYFPSCEIKAMLF